MKLEEKTVFEYVLPIWAVMPIMYGDWDGVNEEERDKLLQFLQDFNPDSGHWAIGEWDYFSWSNDLDNLGGQVVDCLWLAHK